MGMFDTFEASEKHADTFKCGECGGRFNDLQTKSFDCFMDRIRMADDGSLEVKSTMREDEGEGCQQRWRIIKDTCYARVYSSCPVDRTWNEWRLHVREGKVAEIARMPARTV